MELVQRVRSEGMEMMQREPKSRVGDTTVTVSSPLGLSP